MLFNGKGDTANLLVLFQMLELNIRRRGKILVLTFKRNGAKWTKY
jgi:hypothetical protein